MKQLPFYSAERHVVDAWILLMDEVGLVLSTKDEPTETEEATHQIVNVSLDGKNLFWIEIAKEKPSGRHIVIFGPPPKKEGLAAYDKAQIVLLEAGAQKLKKLR